MATAVTLPELGDSIESCTVGRWLKAIGERVEVGEPLLEVITDKVNVEIQSTGAGVLTRIIADEGATVTPGAQIAELDGAEDDAAAAPPAGEVRHAPATTTPDASGGRSPVEAQHSAPGSPPSGVTSGGAAPPGADAAASPSSAGTPAVMSAGSGRSVEASAVTAPRRPAPATTAAVAESDDDTLPRTSPLVRRLAREHGIDLRAISGTGLGGRVTREDILALVQSTGGQAETSAPASQRTNGGSAERAAAGPVATAPGPLPPSSAQAAAAPAAATVAPVAAGPANPTSEGTAGDSWRPLSPVRRAVAEHMVRSVATAPHVTLCVEIDVTNVARARAAAQAAFTAREGFELTYLPFIARAVVDTLREHPLLNAAYQPGPGGEPGVSLKSRIHLGIAVGLDDGLVVPVIKDADALGIAGIARAARGLIGRARAGRLSAEDLRGGTFTLNNTGAFGSVTSSSILNNGQAAILSMEAVTRRPVVVERDGEEAIVIRSIMGSCLTFDHRVLDGLPAGRFLRSLKRRLEATDPASAI